MPVIGLIGSIGAGKSRVAAFLAARGACVIDADLIGHKLLEERSIRERVVAQFGTEVVLQDDSSSEATASAPRVDRKALAAIVFADPAALRALESILHPPMRQEFHRFIDQSSREDISPPVVLDAAVLLEAGWQNLCDRVIFVDAPRKLRLERVRTQRGWSAETLSAREQAQWPLDQKKSCADVLLVNDSDLEHLEREVDRIWSTLSRIDSVNRTDVEMDLTADD